MRQTTEPDRKKRGGEIETEKKNGRHNGTERDSDYGNRDRERESKILEGQTGKQAETGRWRQKQGTRKAGMRESETGKEENRRTKRETEPQTHAGTCTVLLNEDLILRKRTQVIAASPHCVRSDVLRGT